MKAGFRHPREGVEASVVTLKKLIDQLHVSISMGVNSIFWD